MAVRDETTGEEILSLDDRSFAHSARNVLKSTISLHDNLSSLPLYYIQFALHQGGRFGCSRRTSNCFVLGEHRMGRPLSITETFYVDDNLAEVSAVLWFCGFVGLCGGCGRNRGLLFAVLTLFFRRRALVWYQHGT